MFCKYCGNELQDGAKFCTKCGRETGVVQIQSNTQPKEIQDSTQNNTQLRKKRKAPVIALTCVLVLAAAGGAVYASGAWKHLPFMEKEAKKDSQKQSGENAIVEKNTEETADASQKAQMYKQYGEILVATMNGDWESALVEYGPTGGSGEDDIFALADINDDGKEELIIRLQSGSMSEMEIRMYYFDEKSGKVKKMGNSIPPYSEFYENGQVIAQAMRNHSMGMTEWPYMVYELNEKGTAYELAASVSSWEKDIAEEDYSGNPFPEDIDKDGDGVVYVIEEDGDTTYLDEDDYEKWKKKTLETEEISISEKDLEYEQVDKLYDDYKEEFAGTIEDAVKKGITDIGKVFIVDAGLNRDWDSLEDMFDTLDMVEDEAEMNVTYEEDGETVLNYHFDDGGEMSYQTKALKDVELLGLKPGDDMDDAKEQLEALGFYENDGYSSRDEVMYISGQGYYGYRVILNYDKSDKITEISLMHYSKYAG